MKTIAIAAALLGAVGCSTPGGSMAASKGQLRHVVLFKFKDGAPPDAVKAIEEKFRGLQAKIPGIAAFEWGVDVSPEKLSQGFTHCFFVTFPDAAARDAYLPHPAHQDFVALLKPHLDKVLVVDYVASQ